MPGLNFTNFWVDLDLNMNELLNAHLHSVAGSAHITMEGQIGYDLTSHRPLYYGLAGVFEVASLTGTETFTNKTVADAILTATSDVVGISGSGIRTSVQGIRAYASASDVKLVTEKAVILAINDGFATNDAMIYKGAMDCSANPNYPAGEKGHTWKVTVGGHIGGVSGIVVEAGDMFICNTDGSLTGDQATVGAKWDVVQNNIIFPIAATQGGTGQIAYTVGDLLYANSSTTISKLAAVATGSYLRSNGIGVAPSWAAFPTLVTSFLALTDTPSTYTAAGGYMVRVNAGATGLEFWALPTYDNYVSWRINNADSATGAISLTTTSILSILGSGAIAVSAPSAGTTALAKMTLSHSTADGYLHLPSGGVAGNWVKWSSLGTGAWTNFATLTTAATKGLLIGGSTTGSYDPNTTKEIAVDFTQVSAVHSHPYDNYVSWNLLVNSANTSAVLSGKNVDIIGGTYISATHAVVSTTGWSITLNLKPIQGNSIMTNATATSAIPSDFVVTASSVLGRLAAGNIVNILFGTTANTIAWGDHTHAQLHNRQHDLLTTADHTFTGMTAGVVLRGTGVGTAGYSTFTIKDTYSANSLVYASASNTLGEITAGTGGYVLTSVGGVPTWAAITAAILPSGTAKYACLDYDLAGAATTTKTYTKATHGCGLKPLVQFVYEKDVNNYLPTAGASISIIRTVGATQGDVIVTTNNAVKGQVIFIGTLA